MRHILAAIALIKQKMMIADQSAQNQLRGWVREPSHYLGTCSLSPLLYALLLTSLLLLYFFRTQGHHSLTPSLQLCTVHLFLSLSLFPLLQNTGSPYSLNALTPTSRISCQSSSSQSRPVSLNPKTALSLVVVQFCHRNIPIHCLILKQRKSPLLSIQCLGLYLIVKENTKLYCNTFWSLY